jgi:hypothetical protein
MKQRLAETRDLITLISFLHGIIKLLRISIYLQEIYNLKVKGEDNNLTILV